jgi:DNA-binding FadR family transcriptional regulator
MASERRNITVPPELNRKLEQDHINASGLISDLLEAYFAYGDVGEAAEYAAEKRKERQTDALEKACETLSGIPNEELDRFNDAVLNWASKIERRPEDLVEIVTEYKDTGEIPEEAV